MTRTSEADVQLRVLEALESARNYNRWIASLVRPHLGDDPVELGSGLGYQTEVMLSAGLPRVTVSERTAAGVDALSERFSDDPRVMARVIDLDDPPRADHSAAYAVNVLEHVADDVNALAGAAGLVRGGGRTVVFVPAFQVAMSDFDREIGHHRRYRRDTLRAAFLAAGLRPHVVRYVNAPGLLVWMVWMRLLRRRPKEGLGLQTWDRLVVPVTRRIEDRIDPPFGQSVFGVALVP